MTQKLPPTATLAEIPVDTNATEWLGGVQSAVVKFVENNIEIKAVVAGILSRIYTLMKIYAAQNTINKFKEKFSDSDDSKIMGEHIAGIIQTNDSGNTPSRKEDPENFKVQQTYERELLKLISATFSDSNASGTLDMKSAERLLGEPIPITEHGDYKAWGFTGYTPLFHQNIMTDPMSANLREIMFLMYRYSESGAMATHVNSDFPTVANSALVSMDAQWEINEKFLKVASANATIKNGPFGGCLERGPYSIITRQGLRMPRENPLEGKQIPITNPSTRESVGHGYDVSKKPPEAIPWRGNGASTMFSYNSELKNKYTDAINAISKDDKKGDIEAILFMTGPSGTTDTMFTLACILDLATERELKLLRLALIYFMVVPEDHNLLEICYSSLSFVEPGKEKQFFSLESPKELWDSLLKGTGLEPPMMAKTNGRDGRI